ncbi:hypothetical protein C6499_12080 [Candidatus Poribacteria bacterium]|nr:MAG: hypothetical protein C6499_12080 [Candidatus Poribacteria bacterium]
MNLIEVMERFPDQESCIEHLERIRWQGEPVCPHCESENVAPKNETQEEGKVGRTGRYNCYVCRASFKVTQGTVFHGTKIPLQKWFLAIALMTNAKKSLSSYQLSRDLDLNQKTALYIQERIRAEMLKKTKENLLKKDESELIDLISALTWTRNYMLEIRDRNPRQYELFGNKT